MVIKLRSPFVVQKENIPEINNGSSRISPTSLINGSYFYPINYNQDQNDKALISMYNDIPDVSTPLDYLIDKSATIPIRHQVKRGDKWVDVENSKPLDLLSNPNQFSDELLFRKQFYLDYILLANAYMNSVNAVGFSGPGQVYVIPSEKVEPKLRLKNDDYRINDIAYYEVQINGRVLNIPFEEMVHVKEVSKTDDSYRKGRSRLLSVILTSESLRYNYESRVSIYKTRGAMIMLTPKNENVVLDEDDAIAMNDKYNEKFGTGAMQSPNMVSTVPMDVNNISPDIKGLDLNANKTQDFQTICGKLKVPSILLSDNKNSAYNNKVTAERQFYNDASKPLNEIFTNAYMEVWRMDAKTERMWADYSGEAAMQANAKEKVDINSTMYNDDQITRNEYRSDMGLQEVPDGNKTKSEIDSETTQGATS